MLFRSENSGFQRIFRRLFAAEGEARGRFLPIVALERDSNKQKRVRQRALEPIWRSGELILYTDNPALEDFLDEAGELVAIEDSQRDTLKPNPLRDQQERPFGEPVESPLVAENLGEFPDLTDQGESKPHPGFENLEDGSRKR